MGFEVTDQKNLHEINNYSNKNCMTVAVVAILPLNIFSLLAIVQNRSEKKINYSPSSIIIHLAVLVGTWSCKYLF